VDWIQLAQDRDRWLTLVNTVMAFAFYKGMEFIGKGAYFYLIKINWVSKIIILVIYLLSSLINTILCTALSKRAYVRK
jgi:hypothetical protein